MANAASEKRQQILSAILEQIEQGTAPWQKPWTAAEMSAMTPRNATTGRPYSGLNAISLSIEQHKMGTADGRWATFKQIESKGWTLRKGSKSRPIVYFTMLPKIDEGGEKVFIPILRYSNVFNAADVDGIPEAFIPEPEEGFDGKDGAEAALEQIIASSGAFIRHRQQDEAFYIPSRDMIFLPLKDQFPTALNYYATITHELGHWAGHKSRLGYVDTLPYADGELVAQLTSYFLCSQLGTGFSPDAIAHEHGNTASYISSWLKRTTDKAAALQTALRLAGKATDLLMGVDRTETSTNTGPVATQEVAAPEQLLTAA